MCQLSSAILIPRRIQVNSLAPSAVKPLGTIDYLSIALFAGSWIFELGNLVSLIIRYCGAEPDYSAADYQKTQWRKAKDRKEHDEKFISSGLWNISRHPKYGLIPHYLVSPH